MDTIAQTFLTDIEAFIADSDIDPTTLGKQALGDPSFVFDLRKGRSPSARTMDKVRAWMRGNASDVKPVPASSAGENRPAPVQRTSHLTHLAKLEAESIHI